MQTFQNVAMAECLKATLHKFEYTGDNYLRIINICKKISFLLCHQEAYISDKREAFSLILYDRVFVGKNEEMQNVMDTWKGLSRFLLFVLQQLPVAMYRVLGMMLVQLKVQVPLGNPFIAITRFTCTRYKYTSKYEVQYTLKINVCTCTYRSAPNGKNEMGRGCG